MVPTLFFYHRVLIALVWLCLMLQGAWPSAPALSPTTPELPSPRLTRKRAPTPLAGLTTKPPCDACAHSPAPRPPHARPRAGCPREGTAARWRPRRTSARTRTGPIGAGGLGPSPRHWPSQWRAPAAAGGGGAGGVMFWSPPAPPSLASAPPPR